MKLFRLFRGTSYEEPSRKLYITLVNQARLPEFYLDCGVPDTVDGRFDMIVLHAFLVFRRLKRAHEETTDLAQALFDIMFSDMDQNLREMGVGDLGVGKRIKIMAEAFYGRLAVYETGLAGDDDEILTDALRRHLFRKGFPEEVDVANLIRYMRREAATLDALETSQLLAGEVTFGPPPGINKGKEEGVTR